MPSINHALFGDHRDPDGQLTELFGHPAAESAAAVHQAVAWGRGALGEAGVSAEDQVTAVAVLRKAEPRLGLKTATYLAGLLKD